MAPGDLPEPISDSMSLYTSILGRSGIFDNQYCQKEIIEIQFQNQATFRGFFKNQLGT